MRDFREFGNTVAELFHVKMTDQVSAMIRHFQILCVLKKHEGIDPFFVCFDSPDDPEMGFVPPPVYVRNRDELQSDLAALRQTWAAEDRKESLKTMPYSEYLQTKEWKNRRDRKLEASGYSCQVCNAAGVRLDVHHRTYERRGAEEEHDLIVLCRSCHNLFHSSARLAKGN